MAARRHLRGEELRLAQEILDQLARTGEWPSFQSVERALAPSMRVEEVASKLRPDLATWGFNNSVRLSLEPDEILQCRGYQHLLDPLVKAFPVLVDRYLHAPQPRVTHEDLLNAGFSKAETALVYRLLSSTARFTGGGGATPSEGTWHYDLTPATRELDRIGTAQEYLEWWARREDDFRREEHRRNRKGRKPSDLHPWVKAFWIPLFLALLTFLLGVWVGR